MSAGIDTVQPQKHEFHFVDRSNKEPFFENMENECAAIFPYFEELKTAQPVPQYVDPKLAQEALETVNKIRKHYGAEPITGANTVRRLHALLNRIAAAVEKHLFYKKEKHHEEEEEIKQEKLPSLQNWTRWQGGAYGAYAFGSPFFLVAGSLMPSEGLRNFFHGLAKATEPGAQTANLLIDSWKMPDQYKKDLHLQTSSSKKQAEEGLKNLPQQIQQLLQKLIDLNQQIIRTTGQR